MSVSEQARGTGGYEIPRREILLLPFSLLALNRSIPEPPNTARATLPGERNLISMLKDKLSHPLTQNDLDRGIAIFAGGIPLAIYWIELMGNV